MLLLRSIPNPISCCLKSPKADLFLQFKTGHKSDLHYLKNLNVNVNIAAPHSPERIRSVIATVEYLKSRGFSDSDLSRLSSSAPSIFAPFKTSTMDAIFCFLYSSLSASPQEARGLILRCPNLLASDVTYQLEPTLQFLHELGIGNLNAPTNLNAHLLNTPVEKIASKIDFLQEWGLGLQVCRRFPAIFGYSEANNLRPKMEYLVYEMKRGVEEVGEFPQFFGFSLEKRIMPRHLHLRERNVKIALNRMLLWSDNRFYVKWK